MEHARLAAATVLTIRMQIDPWFAVVSSGPNIDVVAVARAACINGRYLETARVYVNITLGAV